MKYTSQSLGDLTTVLREVEPGLQDYRPFIEPNIRLVWTPTASVRSNPGTITTASTSFFMSAAIFLQNLGANTTNLGVLGKGVWTITGTVQITSTLSAAAGELQLRVIQAGILIGQLWGIKLHSTLGLSLICPIFGQLTVDQDTKIDVSSPLTGAAEIIAGSFQLLANKIG